MGSRDVGTPDVAASAAVALVDTLERPSPDLTTTTTADPGVSNPGTLAVVNGSLRFPATNGFKVRVENEIMLITAGAGSNTWNVNRGVDGTTIVAHTTGVTVSLMVTVQRVINIKERLVSYQGMCSTFRTPGRVATAQNLFTIFNAAGSTILIAVRRLSLQVDQTAARLTVAPSVKVARATALPTNGTALGKVGFDSAQASSASVNIIGDASADGTGSGTTLTSTPAATKAWSQFAMRDNTLVGQQNYADEPLIPYICETDPIILRASEGLLAHVVAAATTDNPATAFYLINCMWEEFIIP